MFRPVCFTLLCFLVVVFIAGCAQPAQVVAVPTTPAPLTTSPEEPIEPTPHRQRLAAFFPWVIVDGDFNNIGYVALLTVQSRLQADTTYLQSVDPDDLQDSMRIMVEQGYPILWAHGSQFLEPAVEFARSNPDVIVIVEHEAEIRSQPPNLWVIDRNFHEGFYVLGALAARATSTGKVAYLGWQPMAFSLKEAHAVEQALDDSGLPVSFQAVWTHDLHDAELARRETDRLIAGRVDFIVGSLNQGIFGVIEAAKAAEGKVLVTSKYSDKTPYAPDHHVTTLLYDFAVPLQAILTRIESGETGGTYPMSFENGISLLTPLDNVDPALNIQLEAIIAAIQAGEIVVREDESPLP